MNVMTHLWQSTLCVGVAALLAFALRGASARTRHTIWLIASVKFLVPFSFVVLAGEYLGRLTAAAPASQVSVAIRWLDHAWPAWTGGMAARLDGSVLPLALGRNGMLAVIGLWALGAGTLAAWRWRQWTDVARLARTSTHLSEGREVTLLDRVSRASARQRQIEIRQVPAGLEPGIFGIYRPTLLWPAGLSDRLSGAELEAVLTHEVCHVDRRDNLSAFVHTVVEAVCWFHPLVWWVGARLVHERERACDEDVVRVGADARSYAEGIVKVCGFCLRSPASFVAGIGSPLAKRIERILNHTSIPALAAPARLLLGAVFALVLGAPLIAGVVGARRDGAPAHAMSTAITLEKPAGQDPAKVYQKGDGVRMPKLLNGVKPNYTREAMDAKIQGAVWLEAVVLDNGTVGEIVVTQSLDQIHGLDDAAVSALRQWSFEPGKKDGKPVAVRVEIEMTFNLR